jgi:hypothetical protein
MKVKSNREQPPNKKVIYLQPELYKDYPWIEDICHDDSQESVDRLFKEINDMLLDGYFGCVDEIMSELHIANTPVTILLGILTITLGAKSELSTRTTFYKNVKMYLMDTNQLSEGILQGLY